MRKADVRMRVKQLKQPTPEEKVPQGTKQPVGIQPSAQAIQAGNPQFIRTNDEYEKLPSGARFVWLNGHIYRKP
jgi:hypothetical protein